MPQMLTPLSAYWMGRRDRGALALSWSRSDFAMRRFFAPRRWPQVCRRLRRRRRNPMALQSRSESFHPVWLHNRRLEKVATLSPFPSGIHSHLVFPAASKQRTLPSVGVLSSLVLLGTRRLCLRPVLRAQKANLSIRNVVGVRVGEGMFPFQFVLPNPSQRADLHVGRFCSSESLRHHSISSSELSHKVFPNVGYTPRTSVVDSNRFGIRVKLGLPLGRYSGVSLHCEDCHCKRSPPWSPTCSFSIVLLMGMSFVAHGFGVTQDPVPEIVRKGLMTCQHVSHAVIIIVSPLQALRIFSLVVTPANARFVIFRMIAIKWVGANTW
jgi:hypothetical protein